MSRSRSACLMLVVTVFTALAFVPGASAEDSYTTQLRADVGFSSWPGKTGALKKGLAFTPSDPAYSGLLAAYGVIADKYETEERSLGVVREVRLASGVEQLTITVGVAHTSTDNAQEILFSKAIASSQMELADRLERGDSVLGIAVGDLNFVPAAATSSDVKGYIAFVRNNVVCVIEDGRPDATSSVDLKALAQAIDGKIQGLSDLTPSGFDALRPTINTFSPAMSTLVAQEGSSTTLSITITDPDGPIRKEFESTGQLEVDDNVDPVEVSPTHVLGSIQLTLVAINASLQFNTQPTTITVNP